MWVIRLLGKDNLPRWTLEKLLSQIIRKLSLVLSENENFSTRYCRRASRHITARLKILTNGYCRKESNPHIFSYVLRQASHRSLRKNSEIPLGRHVNRRVYQIVSFVCKWSEAQSRTCDVVLVRKHHRAVRRTVVEQVARGRSLFVKRAHWRTVITRPHFPTVSKRSIHVALRDGAITSSTVLFQRSLITDILLPRMRFGLDTSFMPLLLRHTSCFPTTRLRLEIAASLN